jgi:hypothetical protein
LKRDCRDQTSSSFEQLAEFNFGTGSNKAQAIQQSVAAGTLNPATVISRDLRPNEISDETAKCENDSQEDQ